MSTDKIDTSKVYEMFEEIKESQGQIKEKLMQAPSAATPPTETDLTTVNALTEQLETVIEEARKPIRTEHRHIIEIGSRKVFLSMVVMVITILGLSYAIGNQRETSNQYRDNDLKYRYVKMKGKTTKEGFTGLERQFCYRDSVKIIRKQVKNYEQLVKEHAEKMAKARHNTEEAVEAERLKRETESLKTVK